MIELPFVQHLSVILILTFTLSLYFAFQYESLPGRNELIEKEQTIYIAGDSLCVQQFLGFPETKKRNGNKWEEFIYRNIAGEFAPVLYS